MIENALIKAFEKRVKRGYDTTYWAIDIHDTIVPSTYTYPNNYDLTLYPYMIKAMKLLSSMQDQRLILWSCTTQEKIQELLQALIKHDIYISYFNENPECRSNDISCFDKKFYFDILLDDKAGFDPEYDWKLIYSHIRTIRAFGVQEYLNRVKNNSIALRVDDEG